MRTWITTDSHFGKYNTKMWADIQFDYYYNFFIPTVKKNIMKGDILIHCGDVFDHRDIVDISILNRTLDLFEELLQIFPKIFIICGNHDTYQKNSNLINSIRPLGYLGNGGIELVIDKPKILNLVDKKVALMPWGVNKYQEIDFLKEIESSDFLFAHTSVLGAVYSGSRKVEHGNEVDSFYTFGQVYTGHIHTTQKIKNVRFVGSPYQLTKNDIGNPKLIYLIDFKTGKEISFVNDYSPKFLRVNWKEINDLPIDKVQNILKNNFVDVIVDSDLKDTKEFDKLSKKVEGLDVRNLDFKFKKDNIVIDESIIEGVEEGTELTENDLIKLYLERKDIKANVIEKVQQYIRKEKSNLGVV
jgi:DNA repair exonuclease SbcCD nuclease subunit